MFISRKSYNPLGIKLRRLETNCWLKMDSSTEKTFWDEFVGSHSVSMIVRSRKFGGVHHDDRPTYRLEETFNMVY